MQNAIAGREKKLINNELKDWVCNFGVLRIQIRETKIKFKNQAQKNSLDQMIQKILLTHFVLGRKDLSAT